MPTRLSRRTWSRAEEEQLIRLINHCKDARQLKQVQAYLVVTGQSQNNFLITKLVREFTTFGDLKHARAVVDAVDNPNVYLWTAMIRGYSQQSDSQPCYREAIATYARMHRQESRTMAADQALAFALSSVLKACSGFSALRQGIQIHAHVVKYGYHTEIRSQTALIDFYTKCEFMEEAQKLFGKMSERDVQAWNTMIAGHAKYGNMNAARSLFKEMPVRNLFTWEVMITGYANLGRMDYAKELFDQLVSDQSRLNSNAIICTAMITGYAKCNDITNARLIFDMMAERDVASWNAMISTYSQAGFFNEALDLFHHMLRIGDVKPNQTTITCVVAACAQLGSVQLAERIVDYIKSHGNRLMNNHTVTALIDMHAKCGNPDRASELFKSWNDKDLICYSTMMSGFGMHGRGRDALKIFSHLQEDGLKPDSICFIVVLSACSHGGLVDEGFQYFNSMQSDYSIAPTADHYMCMVDLLGRSGRVSDAHRIITEAMPPVKPHAGVWGALLNACRIYNNIEVGELAAKNLLEMEPENSGNYVLLSNIYAKAQRWDKVAKVRALMRNRGMKKPPGCSWIEIDGKTHKFFISDVRYHQLEMMMQVLASELKAQGYFLAIDHDE
ncbi:PREDICTED: putative pentatricopeptide repeat-containing protein At5g37570 [Nelumbo nucifera]|uniref:Pentatricopeptide repeat-containing protein n=2 Tax=Nelumbo nucifera TaxID=4432 RepID=A0A822XKW7_NELNU|nr:PREDICTED: putative pentatricopeptide repeat-containing protein At5g37570 [Nelumbo nucifera]DAD19719.1 TPA_asm: hypothetical protein HUJ06_021182 [Nelumbo nucifera]